VSSEGVTEAFSAVQAPTPCAVAVGSGTARPWSVRITLACSPITLRARLALVTSSSKSCGTRNPPAALVAFESVRSSAGSNR
jgi:hypothetical protein